MSKVMIEVDTENGAMSIDVDGQKVDGVNDLSIYCGENYEGEMEANVRFCKVEKQGEMRVVTHYSVANAHGKSVGTIQEVDKMDKVRQLIGNYYKSRK
jgi:hypothetical protein